MPELDECRQRPANSRACRPTSPSTATPPARFGITPATVDNALYDAFGQRIISTIFTQSNQYRVILEADPTLQTSLDSLSAIYLPSSAAARRPGAAVVPSPRCSSRPRRCRSTISASSRRRRSRSTRRRASSLGDGGRRDPRRPSRSIGLPPSIITSFQGAALAFQASLGNELLLILAAIVTVYIVLGVLYESYIHPVTILSTCPRPASARCWR